MTPNIKTLHEWAQHCKANHYPETVRSYAAAHAAINTFTSFICANYNSTPAYLSQPMVTAYRDLLVRAGNSPSTINTKLCYVGVFLDYMRSYGVKVTEIKMPYAARTKHRKWWLKDADLTRLMDWIGQQDISSPITQQRQADVRLLRDYIMWTTETGLRVEETLRLVATDFEWDAATNAHGGVPASLIVPGTKTAGSAVKIPLSRLAGQRAANRIRHTGPSTPRLFDISYKRLHALWEECRVFLKVENDPTSTLKALRRNFAAQCLLKGMPSALIQELMRHTNHATTMEYLRLVGLSDNPATREMLNREMTKVRAKEGPRKTEHYSLLGTKATTIITDGKDANPRDAFLNRFQKEIDQLVAESMASHGKGSDAHKAVIDDIEAMAVLLAALGFKVIK